MTSDRGTSGGAEFDLNTPVTPKSPGLNPNASVFLSCKWSTPGAADTGQFEPNDSGISNNTSSVADYSYANGDLSVDKSDAGVFSPTSDSPFQPEFTPFTDNQAYNDTNANIAVKLEETVTNMVLDNQTVGVGSGTFSVDTQIQPPNFAEGSPMTGIQYSNDNGNAASDGEPQSVDGNLSEDQLRQVVKNQLETYFSRENLSGDPYLQSQMDADQYVPIATVANLDQIQRLTSDLQLIVELLRESSFVQVDEKGEKVRPNTNRCIVILREIPDATPVEDVQALFSGENCPKFVSCEFAHNSNWYVTFDSDADAQRAYQYLREEVRTFLGKPIMARIKAPKPLIRSYQPRNGYNNMKRFQQQPPVSQQQLTEAVSSSSQPQFTPTQPFTLMPNTVSLYNGQQAIPFYPPPPNPLLPTWQANPTTMLDPSMVLAMNGYQATNVKVNPNVTNRNMFTNINRNNSRNQKMHSNQPMNRDRINSNESLPPRLQNQHDRQQQQNSGSHMHKTSPRNMDMSSASISNHIPAYQSRRVIDGPNHSSHGNHGGGHGNHSHMAHPPMSQQHHHPPPPPPPPPPHHHQHQRHSDNNVNNNSVIIDRMQGSESYSQRYNNNNTGKSYKSRRRREEDGARPNRSNSSTTSQRDGQPLDRSRPVSVDKQFDYEPTNFPPLPGSGNNMSSGDVFESKLSDVVKGTAKPQVKDVVCKPINSSVTSTVTTTITPTPTTTVATVTKQTSAPVQSKENKENLESVSVSSSSRQNVSPAVVAGPIHPVREPIQTKCASVGSTLQQPVSSNLVRSTAKPVHTVVRDKTSDTSTVQIQSNTDDKTASVSASSVKLSYAQMVQRSKAAEASANALAEDCSDEEGVEGNPLQQSNRANHTLKEQGQQPPSQSGGKTSSSGTKGPTKDFTRKDSYNRGDTENRDYRDSDGRRGDSDKRDDYKKDYDYRRDEPREQRFSARRSKENRERRFGEVGRPRMDRRDRDGPRDGPRTAVAK